MGTEVNGNMTITQNIVNTSSTSNSEKGYFTVLAESVVETVSKEVDKYVEAGKKIVAKTLKENPNLGPQLKFAVENPIKIASKEPTSTPTSPKPSESPTVAGAVLEFAGALFSAPFGCDVNSAHQGEQEEGEQEEGEEYFCGSRESEALYNSLDLKRQVYEHRYKDINRWFAQGLAKFYDIVSEDTDSQAGCGIGNPEYAVAGSCLIKVLMDDGIYSSDSYDNCNKLEERGEIYGNVDNDRDCSAGLACYDFDRKPIVEFYYAVEKQNAMGELISKWCHHTLRVDDLLTEYARNEISPLSDEFVEKYLGYAEYVDWKECENIEGGCADLSELTPNNSIDRPEECELKAPVGALIAD